VSGEGVKGLVPGTSSPHPGIALPNNGRTLSPQQALELVPHLLSTPLTLGHFGLRRMAAHLLLDVATGSSLPMSP
jgi:hypothetical protein